MGIRKVTRLTTSVYNMQAHNVSMPNTRSQKHKRDNGEGVDPQKEALVEEAANHIASQKEALVEEAEALLAAEKQRADANEAKLLELQQQFDEIGQARQAQQAQQAAAGYASDGSDTVMGDAEPSVARSGTTTIGDMMHGMIIGAEIPLDKLIE